MRAMEKRVEALGVQAVRVFGGVKVLVLESVAESSDDTLGGVPSSYLWLGVQRLGWSLDAYQSLLEALKRVQAVRVVNHLVMPGDRLKSELASARFEMKTGRIATVEPVKAKRSPGICGCIGCLDGQLHLPIAGFEVLA